MAELLRPTRSAPSTGEHQARIWAIRDALTGVDDLLGELDDVDSPDLTEFGPQRRLLLGSVLERP